MAHAFFNRGHEHAGNDTALHRIDKLKTLAPLFRLDAQMHLAKLPGPATLFFVAMDALGRPGNGFAIGHTRRLGIDLQLVLAGHFFQLGLEMDFAQAANHRFVAAWMALNDKGRIFHRQLAQDVEQALLVALFLRFNCQPGHRLRKRQRQ